MVAVGRRGDGAGVIATARHLGVLPEDANVGEGGHAPAAADGPSTEGPHIERRARSDALPEHTRYVDTGCDVHSSCLTCPLVRCRYDEPGGTRRLFSESRDRRIVALRRAGQGVEEIASRFGVSRRTVFRALARTKRGGR